MYSKPVICDFEFFFIVYLPGPSDRIEYTIKSIILTSLFLKDGSTCMWSDATIGKGFIPKYWHIKSFREKHEHVRTKNFKCMQLFIKLIVEFDKDNNKLILMFSQVCCAIFRLHVIN